MNDNILEILLKNYDKFTKSEQKIVDYILNNKKEIASVNITDLAALCNVSISTISLFCKKLSLSGFNDFKIEIAKSIAPRFSVSGISTGSVQKYDDVKTIIEKIYNLHQNSIIQTMQMIHSEDIKNAISLIEKAKQVVCLGQGNHSTVATTAFARFSTISDKFKTILDSHLQLILVSSLSKDDVIIYFSYSGATNEFLKLAKLAKKQGCKIILITRFTKSPGATYSDILLQCGSDEKPMSFGSIAAITAQLYIVDVLYHELFCRNYINSTKKREQIAETFSSYSASEYNDI